MLETLTNFAKLAAVLLCSYGVAALLRYHAVEVGKQRYYDVAPYAGMLGAAVSLGAAVVAPTPTTRLATAVMAALFYGLMDVLVFHDTSYAEQRAYRREYGPNEKWVDAYLGGREVSE